MKIEFYAAADIELGEAAQWYGARRAGLDDEFENEVLASLDVIAGSPRAFRAWPDVPEVRVFTMERFPYLIAYTLPSSEELWVLAVAHASRRPGYWLERLDRGL